MIGEVRLPPPSPMPRGQASETKHAVPMAEALRRIEADMDRERGRDETDERPDDEGRPQASGGTPLPGGGAADSDVDPPPLEFLSEAAMLAGRTLRLRQPAVGRYPAREPRRAKEVDVKL